MYKPKVRKNVDSSQPSTGKTGRRQSTFYQQSAFSDAHSPSPATSIPTLLSVQAPISKTLTSGFSLTSSMSILLQTPQLQQVDLSLASMRNSLSVQPHVSYTNALNFPITNSVPILPLPLQSQVVRSQPGLGNPQLCHPQTDVVVSWTVRCLSSYSSQSEPSSTKDNEVENDKELEEHEDGLNSDIDMSNMIKKRVTLENEVEIMGKSFLKHF